MLMMTNIGKPYEGKPHVRFDEEGLGPAQPFTLAMLLLYFCFWKMDKNWHIPVGVEYNKYSRIVNG